MTGVARRTWQVARQLSREHLLEHVLPLGLTPEQEAARWRAGLAELPTVFDGAVWLRAPLAFFEATPIGRVTAARGASP